MKDKILLFLFLFGLSYLVQGHCHAQDNPSIAFVDFHSCVVESKYGIQQQKLFTHVEEQTQKYMVEIEMQLQDTIANLQDSDYVDALTPEAEEKLNAKAEKLTDDLMRQEDLLYQTRQIAQSTISQKMQQLINVAAKEVAKTEHIDIILGNQLAYAFPSSLDITSKVIAQLNKDFDEDPNAEKYEVPKMGFIQ
ncbi:MAG: hypothetical protein S4CHLAM102_09980 [Chlamydiia bacterium]|nr:hypothetical protein [Chlamydiia bacterium]